MQWYLRKIVVHVIAYGTLGYRYAMTCVNTRQDKTRKTRQDKTRQDNTQDKTRQDKTRQDKTRQDKTRQDKTRQQPPNSSIKLAVLEVGSSVKPGTQDKA